MTRTFILSLLAATMLAGCASTPGHQDSGIAAPSFWSRLTGTGSPDKADPNAPLVSDNNAKVEQNWWTHFGDPVLNGLVQEALANNKTLGIAKARVQEARAQRGIARSALFPEVSVAADASRGNQGVLSQNKPFGLAEADLDASWELDLFGQNKARTDEAQALLESEQANQQGVTVELLAELARDYFDMRNYERQIALTKENLETQQKTYDIIQAQKRGDFASGFDVERAAAQVSTTQALVPQFQAQYDAARNRINVLLGQPPGTRDAVLGESQPLQPLDKGIVVAAPATVFATRPDVRAAERQFAASISEKQAATADLFPKITLTALFGIQDSDILPSVRPWSIGANLAQPVLNFGRIESQIDVADAEQKQAFLNYQQTVLQALEDMETSLSAYLHETSRNASLNDAVAQNRKAADLAEEQYKAGLTALIDVLVVQRNLLEAQAAAASSDADLRKDLVGIYTAAGGGWDVATPAPTPASAAEVPAPAVPVSPQKSEGDKQ